MIANLLTIAGVDHVITLDLHASQMQGFFAKPVDNLFAEPLIARWIRMNVPSWRDAVVVSKNAGGTKRVTSLADTLKLNFGIVTTDRRRPKNNVSMSDSMVFFDTIERGNHSRRSMGLLAVDQDSAVDDYFLSRSADTLRPETPPSARRPSELEAAEHTTDERAREVITGRIVQGHLVDEDFVDGSQVATPLPPTGSENGDSVNNDHMTSSFMSVASSHEGHALGGTYDAAESDDDDPAVPAPNHDEKTITLVGDVKDKPVFIIDDMIDRSGSWITAAETVVRGGGAKTVYCIATHGLFGDNCLEEMESSDAIDHIVVTNSFPIPPEKMRLSKKLHVIDVSALLSESIRRHHYGESISALFQLTD
ncbi:ribose phosphate diphosphokinase Prs1, putative [Talaromyces stipitatus ATCC 10500]|uniref:ribose-phosphate diphosphokinase n=1 Tax=Talaromyces stipitatus (strain ATCC 10500 / CBS 375.48 / QM 6759 / NRRL 1006) TaxID=441959 RepID=B8MIS6_TALSN|nr:ribose phosphate diphosphokinase Prs1, putative [Talaromyces stipitatus ATCC 10500]XP_002485541.1 ribose phosphate diphosphokinase Prs1, putative [Talaromyces stipitatus ATCC 10500]EED15587.1 ribose phosphate diphosphokinase Prs1, putative [Talaromyces stipitatus ATCC 10500]EED15588.1 ribose phosphate diphosphokinase Prs1, putative [Talaromyces stipitatus ATCC 10500]